MIPNCQYRYATTASNRFYCASSLMRGTPIVSEGICKICQHADEYCGETKPIPPIVPVEVDDRGKMIVRGPGLGDKVEAFIKAVTLNKIHPCGRCTRDKKRLNKLWPGKIRKKTN